MPQHADPAGLRLSVCSPLSLPVHKDKGFGCPGQLFGAGFNRVHIVLFPAAEFSNTTCLVPGLTAALLPDKVAHAGVAASTTSSGSLQAVLPYLFPARMQALTHQVCVISATTNSTRAATNVIQKVAYIWAGTHLDTQWLRATGTSTQGMLSCSSRYTAITSLGRQLFQALPHTASTAPMVVDRPAPVDSSRGHQSASWTMPLAAWSPSSTALRAGRLVCLSFLQVCQPTMKAVVYSVYNQDCGGWLGTAVVLTCCLSEHQLQGRPYLICKHQCSGSFLVA